MSVVLEAPLEEDVGVFVLELAVAASDPKVNALSLATWLPTRFASDGGTKVVRAVAAFLTRKLEPTLQPPLLESHALEQLAAVRILCL